MFPIGIPPGYTAKVAHRYSGIQKCLYKQEKINQRLFYRDDVEAWCDMQIHEALWKVLYVMKCSHGVPSVMLGRSNFSVYFRYTGRVRNFGYFFAVC